jgi:hypothetical protein
MRVLEIVCRKPDQE